MIKNPQINAHEFLVDMYSDDYFPNVLVDKVKQVLLNLCEKIESKQPENLEKIYILTHEAIEKINDLQKEFDEADSEIETVARESIAENFDFIAQIYGFIDADVEELISGRDW